MNCWLDWNTQIGEDSLTCFLQYHGGWCDFFNGDVYKKEKQSCFIRLVNVSNVLLLKAVFNQYSKKVVFAAGLLNVIKTF